MSEWIRSGLVLVLAVAAAWPMPSVAQEGQTEVWEGSVDLSSAGGTQLDFVVRFARDESGALSATIDIPAQGAEGLPLVDVEYGSERLAFTLEATPRAVFEADRDGDRATGTLTQGIELPLEMERLAEGERAGPERPQHPRPPFPYLAEEVVYRNPADDSELAGTLTVPEGDGPHPAALLITGSGLQDRDETIFGHKPFLVIADHLTRAGVAVLRVDDRGIGGSTGSVEGVTAEIFVSDVLAGVRFLGSRPEIDASGIGLIGHSEGGMLAPMAAVEAPGEVAWMVLLAGTGIPGSELMPMQLSGILRAAGVPDASVERQVAIQEAMIRLILEDAPESAIREQVEALILEQAGGTVEAGSDAFRTAVDTTLRQVTSAWYRRFLRLDPRDYLRRVEVPVLALNGSLDLQVPAGPNLRAIAEALRAGGNPDVTVRELDGLNHLFQPATTGLVAEYGVIEQTFAPSALETIADWVRARSGLE